MAHQISAADVLAIFTGYKTTMMNAFAETDVELGHLVSMESSELEREAYPISAMAAVMQRWNGDRKFQDLLTKVVYVENGQKWEHSYAFQRRDIQLRRKMQVEQAAIAAGKAAKLLNDDLVVTALQGGTAAAYVDGVNFFATNHPIVPWDATVGTYANRKTGFGLTAANVQTVLTEMRGRRGWDNRPMRLRQFTITVPSALEWTARRILEQELSSDPGVATAGGNTNILKGRATVKVASLLDDEPTVWYISADDSPVKPFALQEWQPLEVAMITDLNSEAVFHRDQFESGQSRGVEIGRMLPHAITRCET